MGERALLVEAASLEDVLRLHAALEASRVDGVVDLVPAARTVLVTFDPRALTASAARTWIEGADASARVDRVADEIELPVAYDGEDLEETAALLGMSPEALARRHSEAAWTVAFTGFAPGFGYLVSDEWPYDVPRLSAPRTRVPAGAVGLAAAFSGAYPRATPGGWRLIGTTPAVLFDPSASSPALLVPGARVRFRPVGSASPPMRGGEPGAGPRSASGDGGFVVVEPGLLATIQDLGRPGGAHLGVARSGALDRGALRTANRLVGNGEDAAGVEVTMGGFRARARTYLWVAVTGAWGPVRIDDHEVDPYAAVAWPAGTELHLDGFDHGVRAYLAVRGGVDAAPALGSRATDILAGLGPAPLRAGDEVFTGEGSGTIPVPDVAPWGPPHDDELELQLAPGPRADWFASSALADLFERVWTVSPRADRVGVRLEGPALRRVRDGELPSEGMVPGAVQVPPDGIPTVLLADGPVTGGYPVIAVVADASLDALAQARPGTRVRFRHARV